MLKAKSHYGEAGYIAEELLGDKTFESDQLCKTIQDMVERKVFTREEALEAYEVDEDVYDFFLAKDQRIKLLAALGSSGSKDLVFNTYFKVISYMVEGSYGRDARMTKLIKMLREFSKTADEEKIKI